MDTTKEFTVIEFCTGYGGIHLGLKRAIPNLRLLAASEIEAFVVANLVAKMEAGLMDPAPVWPDLKTFPSREFHGLADLLVAGFPCQPFSAAGNRCADDDPRHLFPYIKQSIIDMQPRFVFLENVEGIISAKLKSDDWADPAGTPVLLHVLRELERVGYRATAGVFSAAEVGAPHRRKRVFIMARLPGERLEGVRECCGSEGREAPVGEMCVSLWPSRPGELQHCWEPPRVVADGKNSGRGGGEDTHNADGERIQELQSDQRPILRSETARRDGDGKTEDSQAQSPLGGDADGTAGGLDYAELYSTCDNRADELRLLGNGVVPATAERAWRTLYERIIVHVK